MTSDQSATDPRIDRILELLPQVIRDSDAFAGQPLRALLQVMASQANLVEDDIAAMLDNWFVETCDDWVLPYIGELIGYQLVPENGRPQPGDRPRDRARMQALMPRREVANTIHYRRRKGALLLLEELAATTGWPARAVEYRRLIAATPHSRFLDGVHPSTLSVRDSDLIDRGYGPFNEMQQMPDLRRLSSFRTRGRGSVSSIGLFVWRLKSHEVCAGECRPAGRIGKEFRHLDRFTIHPAGFCQPLFTHPEPLPARTGPATESEVPGPLRPRAFMANPFTWYGPEKSLQIGWSEGEGPINWLPIHEVVIANLVGDEDEQDWLSALPGDHPLLDEDNCHIHAAIDLTRGRVLFRRQNSEIDPTIWARHQTAFSADIGGGSYFRTALAPATQGYLHWYVRQKNSEKKTTTDGVFGSLAEALAAWHSLGDRKESQPRRVLIELEDDSIQKLGDHGNSTYITEIRSNDWLQIRAGSHVPRGQSMHYRRPVISPAPGRGNYVWKIKRDSTKDQTGTFILEGVMVVDFTLTFDGPLSKIDLRHCTLLAEKKGRDKALEFDHLTGCIAVDKSIIIGSIHVDPKGRPLGVVCPIIPPPPPDAFLPVTMSIVDSLLAGDTTDHHVALSGVKGFHEAHEGQDHQGQDHHPPAFVDLHVARTTVFGNIDVYTLELAEDSIFNDRLRVENTGRGCLRFCSIHYDDVLPPAGSTQIDLISPTPSRYDCQPDLALAAYDKLHPFVHPGDVTRRQAAEAAAPRFTSPKYPDPAFAQLADDCPVGILRGASDESEMGVFHDLYTPQREALLRARLTEYTLAGVDAQLLFAT